MRNFLILSLLLITLMLSNCGSNTGKDAAGQGSIKQKNEAVKVVFNTYEHDFGKVTEGEKIGYTFTFENQGTEDLVITSAITSCGCTVPKYDKKPVRPGEKGNLEVLFDTSGRKGMQTKTISVKSNASTPVVILKITAEVVQTISN